MFNDCRESSLLEHQCPSTLDLVCPCALVHLDMTHEYFELGSDYDEWFRIILEVLPRANSLVVGCYPDDNPPESKIPAGSCHNLSPLGLVDH